MKKSFIELEVMLNQRDDLIELRARADKAVQEMFLKEDSRDMDHSVKINALLKPLSVGILEIEDKIKKCELFEN